MVPIEQHLVDIPLLELNRPTAKAIGRGHVGRELGKNRSGKLIGHAAHSRVRSRVERSAAQIARDLKVEADLPRFDAGDARVVRGPVREARAEALILGGARYDVRAACRSATGSTSPADVVAADGKVGPDVW